MRRKVLQHFADVLCQRYVDLLSGSDAAAFAHHGSGAYVLNVLTGECSKDGVRIDDLPSCAQQCEWLNVQLERHHVPAGLERVQLRIRVVVSDVHIESGHPILSSAHFAYECRSDLRTDERSYVSERVHTYKWGFTPIRPPLAAGTMRRIRDWFR